MSTRLKTCRSWRDLLLKTITGACIFNYDWTTEATGIPRQIAAGTVRFNEGSNANLSCVVCPHVAFETFYLK
jgi:hypothetical protein